MKDKLKQIQQKALSAFQDAREIKDVDDLKVKFLGKKGVKFFDLWHDPAR